MATATTAAAPSTLRRPIMLRALLELERRTHGEVELAEFVPRSGVWIDAVVDADGPEGRVPAQTHAHRVLEAREVDLRSDATVGAIHVARVEEEGQLGPPEGRDGVLQVAEDLEVASDPRARLVSRGDLTELEAADGIGAAEVEALEERHGLVVPADLVAGAETRAQHVPEPQELMLDGGGGESDVAVVLGEDAREVGPDGGEVSLRGIEEAVAGVARERPADERGDGGALGVQQLLARVRIHSRELVLLELVDQVPPRVVTQGMTHPDIAAQRIDGVVIEDAPVIVQVEARGEGSIEEPGLGEADGALLGAGAPAQAKEHLPAPAEEIVLGEVEGA